MKPMTTKPTNTRRTSILLLPLLLVLAACAPRAAQAPQHVYRAAPGDVIAAIRTACPKAPADPFYDAWRVAGQQPGEQTCFSGPSLSVGAVDQSSVEVMTFTVTEGGGLSSVTVRLQNNAGRNAADAVFRSLDAALPHP